jgi:TonB-linked SusC/RagA family outer membrane protein
MKHLFHRIALITAILCMSGAAAAAQGLRGTVKDSSGEPVIGAAVMVEGTSTGTTTDLDGQFVLTANVAPNAVLVVSSIGYQTQTVYVAGRTVVDIVLEEDAEMLDDVVVIGYGVQKKSVVTASIAKVSSEDLAKAAPIRVDAALKGLAAGVNVTANSGQPGESSRIRVRGTGTINNSDPLYIVDGMPIEGGIDFLNPSDIESIEVLKDAASGAVYGARAANGVILVTTKKGDQGSARVSYNFTYGASSPWREREVLNASEYAMMINEGFLNSGAAPVYKDPWSYGKGTDWQKEVFNYNAPQRQHELSVSGASETVNYYLSLGYNSQEGIVGGNFGRSNYDRLTLRSNTSYILFDKSQERDFLNKATLTSNLSYAKVNSTGISTNSAYGSPLGSALALSPILKVYEDDPQAQMDQFAGTDGYTPIYSKDGRMYMIPGNSYNEMVNPVASLSLPGSQNWSHKFVAGLNSELQLIDGLRFRTSLGADLSFWGYDSYTPLFYLGSNNKATFSSASGQSSKGLVWQVENILTYEKSFDEHSFSLLLGQSAKESSSDFLGANAQHLKSYDKPYISYTDGLQENGERNGWGAPNAKSKLASYFFRASYNYAERYMAELTVRRDGSSRFGANNHWATFPSFSLGWNIHREPYIDLPSWMSMAKARFSWGKNGNENIGNFGYTVLTSGGNNYIFGDTEETVQGVKASGLSNQSLRWEESIQTDLGLDFGFLHNSVTFTIDWFKKVTDGMLMTMNIPSYVGESKPTGNVGIMQNSGVELEGSYKYGKKDFNFRVAGNLSYLRNKLIEYGNESGWANLDSFQGTGTISRAENGMPFPYFYGYKTDGIFQNVQEVRSYTNSEGRMIQPNALPGDVRFVDVNEDGIISDADRTFIGKGTPDWTWGLNFYASWRGFDFSMLLQGTIGNDIYDATRRADISYTNLPAYMLGRWTGDGTSNRLPRFVIGDSVNWVSSDLMVYDGTYARLKNIQLGYTLPASLTRQAFISSLRMFVAAENLLTFTTYHGFDPEIASGGTSLGIDYGVYPQARTLSVGFNLAF